MQLVESMLMNSKSFLKILKLIEEFKLLIMSHLI